ncbi:hypothetical protein C3F09_08080 [candidate division GN15 bacterium]|uniref:Solute-binding protein family 5 domain-containing protein n=1 Tax=candidate division GN15 bacterium TaxID=2072418 RepID=A0A855X5Q1_9BACT|nr:MAG: hypothetical protein C3F09_08080 [candidate division GN15 bacterium]
MKQLLSIILLILLSSSAPAVDTDGVWVPCKILQCKLNRLYFDVGEESRVFAGYRAVVIHKKDTVWSGVIERAFEGVAISEPIAKLPEIKSVSAFVQTAPVDSHAVLIIGTAMMPPATNAQPVRALDGMSARTKGLVDSVIIRDYADNQSMQVDFQTGKIDGVLTCQAESFSDPTVRVESTPANFVAAMIPKASSAINRRMLLTSSLIARFDTSIARGLFDGSDIRYLSRLSASPDSARWYAFDPERGRRMLRQEVDRSAEIRIYAPSRELRKIAGYFADLLARDQYKSRLVESWEECDFSLAFIPADPRDLQATYQAILRRLGPESSAVVELGPSLREVSALLQNAGVAKDSLQQQHDLQTAEQILISDLGCYPLFRPRVYFVSHREIRGSIFNADGGIDPAGLMRVRPINGSGPR